MAIHGIAQDKAAAESLLMHYVRDDIPGRFNEAYMLKKEFHRILCCFQGIVLPPYEVIIQPSSTCNLRCIWCIGERVPITEKNSHTAFILRSSKFMRNKLQEQLHDPKIMEKVIKNIISYKKYWKYIVNGKHYEKEFKIENVTFSGLVGEPLVAKRSIIPAMQLLGTNGIRTGLYTNGELMDESTLDTIVKIAYVNISFDTASAKMYRHLKCGNDDNGVMRFNKLLKNIRALAKLKSKTPGETCEINASFVLYPENYREVYNAAVILKDLGIRFFRIKQDISMEYLLNDQQKSEVQLLLDKIKNDLEDRHFKFILIHRLYNPNDMKRDFLECVVTNLIAAVGSDGNLYPCNYHPRPNGLIYGSIVHNTFKEVWEGAGGKEINNRNFQRCPPVCDPFKNRANRLLNVAKMLYVVKGASKLQSYIEKIKVPR